MIVYADSSSLAKLYADEPGSSEATELLRNAEVLATSALAYAEIRAALARRHRDRSMTSSQFAEARRQFESDWDALLVLPCNIAQVRRAGELAEKHGLRGADAIHLAAFEGLLTSTDDEAIEFSCADARLTQAARKLG